MLYSIQVYINTSGNWKNEKLYGNTPVGRSVSTKFRVFSISTSVDISEYQYGIFLITLTDERRKITSYQFTLSYVNTALNKSASRIPKCYIIKLHLVDRLKNLSPIFTVLTPHSVNNPLIFSLICYVCTYS